MNIASLVTQPGIKCGNCKQYHRNSVAVRNCYAERYDLEAQAKAEIAAEQAAERYYEEGTAAQHLQYQGELEMESQALGRPWWS